MAARATTLLLLLWLHGPRESSAACENVTALSMQLDALLAEYDRETPPGASVTLSVALDVRHASVLEHDSAVRLLADLRMNWKDARLSWNASEWGCDMALTSADRLWVPDVAVVNAMASSAGEDPLRARVSSDGSVAWISRLDLTAPLALHLADWPHDVQTCVFKFASRAHTVDELDIQIKDLKYATVFESGTWEIASLIGSMSTWNEVQGSRRLVMWSLALQRRAAAQELVARVVVAATVLMLLAAALLPPADRAPLAAATSFTAALWLISALMRLPGADSAPRVLALVGGLCACGGVAAAAAALVHRVARVSRPPPRALRDLVSSATATFKLSPSEGVAGESGVWAAAARLLDATLLTAITLAAFILLCVFA